MQTKRLLIAIIGHNFHNNTLNIKTIQDEYNYYYYYHHLKKILLSRVYFSNCG
jgi:hypothetical protein